MDTQGQHLLFDVWLSQDIAESDIRALSGIVRSEFRVVEEIRHDFDPHGTTLVLILAESHFTIHTYPEERYLSMDLYLCGPAADLERVCERLVQELRVGRMETRIIERGAPQTMPPRVAAERLSRITP